MVEYVYECGSVVEPVVSVVDLVFTCVAMLLGKEGVDWECYKIPPVWWPHCLWTIRN